jgi:ATP-dependent protease ClpP protease subunit
MPKGIKVEIPNAASDIAELYLYGTIRKAYPWESEEDSYISAAKVRKALDELKGKDVNVHINSGGGDVFESIAISNLIRSYEGDTNIYVDALAGSGASIIAAAGDKVYMFDNSMQMIHKAWTCVCGNADELRKAATDMDKIDESVKASYSKRFVGTTEELDELLKDESWLTADECIAFGLADEKVVIDDTPDDEGAQNNVDDPEPKVDIRTKLFEKYGQKEDDEVNNAQDPEPKQEKDPEPAAQVNSTLLSKFKKQ